jgi:hypothetical protein
MEEIGSIKLRNGSITVACRAVRFLFADPILFQLILKDGDVNETWGAPTEGTCL